MTTHDPDTLDHASANPQGEDDAAAEAPGSAPPEPEEPLATAATEEVAASGPGSRAETESPTGDEDARDDEDKNSDPDDDAPDRTAELEAEHDRLRDRHLRLAADFDNFRKRTEERVRRRWDSAQADLVGKFLDPLDDLLRVTALEPGSEASVDSIVEGIDLVERKFMHALREAGVETVDPEDEPFDPNTMEAMMRVPADSDEMDDTVAQVFQRGYTLRGLLIRPARVSVFKCQ